MNILYLSNHLNAGGITSYLLTQARGMRKNGHNVFIASCGGDMEDFFIREGVQLLTLNLKTKSELSLKVYIAAVRLIKYVRDNDIDVVHANTRITQVIGQILLSLTHCTFVSTCHGYFKRRLGRILFPCWGEEVAAISQQVLEHLQNDFKVKLDQIKLIENGVDIDHFAAKDEYKVGKLRQRFGLKDEKIIGLVARLSDIKGQDVLIRAMERIIQTRKDVKCFLVGQGKMEEEFKMMVETLGLSGYVEFAPTVNETRNFLHLFDVAVMPSRQEGLGLSIIEAQASFCPVVASRVGGIPSLIEHEKTGLLVESEDVEGFAQNILRILEDSTLRDTVVKNAHEHIAERFSAEAMVSKTITMYERLIKRKILS